MTVNSYLLQEFLYPVHTGLPVGTDDSPKVVVMETHFDNPNEKSGKISW